MRIPACGDTGRGTNQEKLFDLYNINRDIRYEQVAVHNPEVGQYLPQFKVRVDRFRNLLKIQ
jgi:hypothetical protein